MPEVLAAIEQDLSEGRRGWWLPYAAETCTPVPEGKVYRSA